MWLRTCPSSPTSSQGLLGTLSRWPPRPGSPRPTFLPPERCQSPAYPSSEMPHCHPSGTECSHRNIPHQFSTGRCRTWSPSGGITPETEPPLCLSLRGSTKLIYPHGRSLRETKSSTAVYHNSSMSVRNPNNQNPHKNDLECQKHRLRPAFRVFQMFFFFLLPQCSLLWSCRTLLANHSQANKASQRTALLGSLLQRTGGQVACQAGGISAKVSLQDPG